ncbi:MAG: ATP-binding cassette domain-containing protein [Candidatus Zixiibacteriota bacterium]
MRDDATILEVRDLSRVVRDGKGVKRIIDRFTFSFQEGSVYTIIGPSGAGKSSLLRLLNRLDEPSEGEIFFRHQSIKAYSPCQLRRKIGFLFQTPYLFLGTVRDNLLYADNKLPSDAIERLITQVQIPLAWIERSVDTLSIGEKQRVALARLLATGPEIVLLDEPTSALDPSYTESIETLIKDIVHQMGLTVIMVTHNPQQALRIGGKTLLMVAGRLIESGPCQKVISDPRTEAGRLYKMKQLK